MANKPIKQYATLTDEAGVEAMTVATGGAVTVGPSGFSGTHSINGNVYVNSRTFTLASDATATFVSGNIPYLHTIRIDASGNLRVGQFVTTGGASTAALFVQCVGVGSINLSNTLNNAGTVNIYPSGDNVYIIQNKTGVAIVVVGSSSAL
jgi:hypothetical protein